jgi:hypothetical protein
LGRAQRTTDGRGKKAGGAVDEELDGTVEGPRDGQERNDGSDERSVGPVMQMDETGQSGRDEMKETDLEKPARRNLLKGLLFGAAAASAAGTATGAAQAASPETDDASGGYRESDHVRRYYELADD